MHPVTLRCLLPLSLALVCTAHAGASASPSPGGARPREGLVRLLSVADEIPVRYKRGANGEAIPLFAGSDETPPAGVYLKIGEKYEFSPLLHNAVSPPHKNKRDKKSEIQGYFIRNAVRTDNAEAYAQSMGAKPAAKASQKAEEPVQWALLAKAVPADGVDYLLCVYQPNPNVKWYAPKTLLVDISSEKLPLGASLVLNLCDRPVLAQVGANSKPLQLAPGAHAYVLPPSTPAQEALSFKMASMGRNGPEVVFNRDRNVPSDARVVFVAYSSLTRTEGKSVLAKVCPLTEPPRERPEEKSAKPAKVVSR